MIIRSETPSDIPPIRALTEAAFATAAHASGTEGAIVDALRAAGALTLSLVAEQADRLLGHIAFSPVVIDGADPGWFGLGPVSVAPDRQRSGIGTALVARGLAMLRERGAGGCVVLGDPAYYRRFGFVADPALRYGSVPPEYFQSLILAGGPEQGLVAYHPAFEAPAEGPHEEAPE